MARAFLAVGLVTLMTASAGGAWHDAAVDPPLRVQVSPRFGHAPAEVRIQAFVEPARENRFLQVVIESAEYYRSSAIELNGDLSSRVHFAAFRSVPSGLHHVRVAVVDRRGDTRAAVNDSIQIVD